MISRLPEGAGGAKNKARLELKGQTGMRKSLGAIPLFILFSFLAASAQQTAIISLSPDSFVFNAVQGGPNPPPQILQIRNVGTGSMGWAFGSGIPSWLSVIPPGPSTAPADVQLTALTGSRVPGTYVFWLKVYSSQASNSPDSVKVRFTISSPQTAIIFLSPDTFNFFAIQGGSPPPPETLQIQNTGTGQMGWLFGLGIPSWLSVIPAGPSTAPRDVQLTALPGNLTPGTRSYYLKVYSNEATNSPDSVRITFTVASAQTAVLSLSPDSFHFTALQGGPPPPPQTLEIRNTGAGTMGWAFGTGHPSWLAVSPPGPGTDSADVQLTALPGSWIPGTYSYYLKVYSNQATNSPDSVRITFTITSAQTALISFSPPSFSFNAVQDGPLPVSQTLQISNSGSGILNWSISSDFGEPFIDMDGDDQFDPTVDRFITCNCPENQDFNFNSQYDGEGITYSPDWIAPTPVSGTAPSSVTVAVTRTNLPPGTYPGKLTITGNATNSPQEVPVNFEVTEPPVLSPASLEISHPPLDFNVQRNQPVPPETIVVSNGGQLPLNWSATILHGASWLSINPASGTNDGSITVSVATDLNPMTYADTIVIEAPGALNSPAKIPVRLNITTDVGDEPGNRPRSFTLFQNYPNPFNPTTKIDFALPRSGRATLEVFNVVGQRIRVLFEGELPAGRHSIVWDGRETSGQMVGSGVYFYRLKSQNFSEIKRMVFLK